MSQIALSRDVCISPMNLPICIIDTYLSDRDVPQVEAYAVCLPTMNVKYGHRMSLLCREIIELSITTAQTESP